MLFGWWNLASDCGYTNLSERRPLKDHVYGSIPLTAVRGHRQYLSHWLASCDAYVTKVRQVYIYISSFDKSRFICIWSKNVDRSISIMIVNRNKNFLFRTWYDFTPHLPSKIEIFSRCGQCNPMEWAVFGITSQNDSPFHCCVLKRYKRL